MKPLSDIQKNTGIGYRTMVAVGLTGLLLVLAYHIGLIVFPYPQGYRECGELLQTAFFKAGINPYDIRMIPGHGNLYGFIFGLVSLPFVNLTHSALMSHEIVVGLFILGNLLFMYRVMKYYGFDHVISIHVTIILYLLYLSRENAVVNCSMVGMLWYLLSVYIPLLTKFSRKGLVLSIFFAIIGFYTKAYFAFGAITVGSYLFLFVSKKKGLSYLIAFSVMMLASAALVNRIFPTYFLQVILGQYTASINDFRYTLFQIYMLSTRMIPFMVLIMGMAIISFIRGQKTTNINTSVFGKWSVGKLREPLISGRMEYSLFCALLALAVFLVKLGGNVGSYLNYLIHLVIPFALVAMLVDEKIRKMMVTRIFLLFNVMLLLYQVGYRQFPDIREYQAWEKIERIISNHQHILGSPLVGPIVMQQGKRVYDTGLNESTAVCAADSSLNASIPLNSEIIRRTGWFRDSINQMIRNQTFDVIIVNQEGTWLANPNFIRPYYEVTDSIELSQAHCVRHWKLLVWKPREKVNL